MPINKAILKEQLQFFPKSELVEMLLKLSKKGHNYDFLLINYLDTEGGEQQLFDETIEKLIAVSDKEFKGRTVQHQRVKMLSASIKCINEFMVEAKNKKLEADLICWVLVREFEQPASMFGAKFSGYDFKIGLLTKRLIGLVQNKLHPDYFIDYQDQLNEFLTKLHKTSNRINTIKALPYSV
ncbi:MAG: hypothetical protein ACOYM7_03900 [Paludibacter sp.]